jgi:hypothetical protein
MWSREQAGYKNTTGKHSFEYFPVHLAVAVTSALRQATVIAASVQLPELLTLDGRLSALALSGSLLKT